MGGFAITNVDTVDGVDIEALDAEVGAKAEDLQDVYDADPTATIAAGTPIDLAHDIALFTEPSIRTTETAAITTDAALSPIGLIGRTEIGGVQAGHRLDIETIQASAGSGFTGRGINVTPADGADTDGAVAAGAGGVVFIEGGDGGAGDGSFVSGDGGDVTVRAGAAGTDGGAGGGSAGTLHLGADGTDVVDITAAGVGAYSMTGALTLTDGTVSAASVRFASTNAGLYNPGGAVGIASAPGTEIVRFGGGSGSEQVLANTTAGATTPQYSFLGKTSTGLGLDGGEIQVRVSDVEAARFFSDGTTANTHARLPVGSASAPGVRFLGIGGTSPGLFAASGVLGISTSGTERVRVDDTGATPQVLISGSRLLSDGTQAFIGEAGAEWDTIHVGKISTSGDLELAQSGVITAPDLTASGAAGLPFSVLVDHSGGTEYYDGARIDVDASGTIGDGTDDPDGIGNTVQRWRVDSGSGLETVAAVDSAGTLHVAASGTTGAQMIHLGDGDSYIGVSGGQAVRVTHRLGFRYDFDGAGFRIGSAGLTFGWIPDDAQFGTDGSNQPTLLTGSTPLLRGLTDPTTPTDGDTNIAIREHQDPGGGVTAALSDVTVGDMTVDGQRVLTVPNRASATMPIAVSAAGNTSIQGRLDFEAGRIALDQVGGSIGHIAMFSVADNGPVPTHLHTDTTQTGGEAVNFAPVPIDSGYTYWLEAHVTAGNAATGDTAAFVVRVRAWDSGGGAAIGTVESTWTDVATGLSVTCTFVVDGASVALQVNDDEGGSTITWAAEVRYQRVQHI